MFPPHNGSTTFFPFSSGTSPARQAASGAAPAPSTTAFSNSTRRKIARAMSCSPTRTVLSTKPARDAQKHSRRPAARLNRPRASASLQPAPVCPACIAAVKLAARSGSTPMIFTRGFNVFTASASPGNQSRAADGHDHRIDVGNLRDNLQPEGSLPGDDGRIVESADVSEFFFRGDFIRAQASPRPDQHRAARPCAPSRRQFATFISGANRGMTTVAGMPSNCA